MAVMTKEQNTLPPTMQALREQLDKLTRELETLGSEIQQAEAALRLGREAHEETQVGEVVGTHDAQGVTVARVQLERHEAHLRALRDRRAVVTAARAQLDRRQFDVEMAEIRATITELVPSLRTRTKKLGQALAAAEAAYLEAGPVAERIQDLFNRHFAIEVRVQRQGGQSIALPVSSSMCGLVLTWANIFQERYSNKSKLDDWREYCDQQGVEL